MPSRRTVLAVDPFELPDWLGTKQVFWAAQSSVRSSHQVTGQLTGAGEQIPCDLLAADQAYPQAVMVEEWRGKAHQAWNHGQVLLVDCDGRLTLAVPGTLFTADLVLETLARLAKAVGVTPDQYLATLRL